MPKLSEEQTGVAMETEDEEPRILKLQLERSGVLRCLGGFVHEIS